MSQTRRSPIVRDPEIMGCTPVFAGTRVPIRAIFDYLEGRESLDRFLQGFPTVEREQAIEVLRLAKRDLLT